MPEYSPPKTAQDLRRYILYRLPSPTFRHPCGEPILLPVCSQEAAYSVLAEAMRECSREPSSIDPLRSWCIEPALEKRRSTPAASERTALPLYVVRSSVLLYVQ